jgi:hypothetical protein
VSHAELGAGGPEDVRDVAAAVVGEDAFGLDAPASKPADRPVEEARSRLGGLVGQDLDVGQAAVVIDADVDKLPPAPPMPASAVACDPMAHATKAPEFLGVQVQQLAGSFALVADHRGLGLQARQTLEAPALEHGGDGGTRHAHAGRDLGAGESLTSAKPFDANRPPFGGAAKASGSAGAILKSLTPLSTVAGDPAIDRSLAHRSGLGHVAHGPAETLHALYDLSAGVRGRLRVRMKFHLGSLRESG